MAVQQQGVEIMKKILIASCIALLGSASAAQPPVVVTKNPGPSKVVSYADLNLTSKSGQERLSTRIRAAARDICFEDNIEQVKFVAARRHCYDTALSGAFNQMNEAIASNAKGSALAAATLVVRGE
jgi:UrcA family protein